MAFTGGAHAAPPIEATMETKMEHYILTLDSHDYYGPFFTSNGHSSYWWAHDFARMRGLRSYQIVDKRGEFSITLPVTCPIRRGRR